MSNETAPGIVDELEAWVPRINIFMNLFYLIVGNFGNLLKVGFFLQKPLRSVPCSVYILISTCSDFVTLNNLPALQLLADLYPGSQWIKASVDWSNYQNDTSLTHFPASIYDILLCKQRTYFHMLSTDLSFQMLLCASINRYLSTYRRMHQQSNPCDWLVKGFCDFPHVHRLCLMSIVVLVILSFQHLINFTVTSPFEGCVPRSHFLWASWTATIHCLLLPVLMIIFGALTVKNVHYLTLRSRRPSARRFSYHACRGKLTQNQTERQMTSMIIAEILFTVLGSLPYGAYAFHHLLLHARGKRAFYTHSSKWIILFVRSSMYVEASCGFYVYIFTLGILRQRFFKVIRQKLSFTCSSPPSA